MAASFSEWQSQLGETSMTREMWKHGRPSTTALAYSAILRLRLVKDSSQFTAMALRAQMAIQRPQPTHLLWSMNAFLSVIVIPSWAQILVHIPQPTQSPC